MKTNIAKVLLLALVLAVALTGCNLIEIDPVKQAEEDIAKIDKAYAAPVATYGDQVLTASDAMAEFNMAYNQTYYMYSIYGMQMTAEDARQLMADILTEQVRERIVANHFEADGMALTEEEMAECETQTQTSFDEGYASFMEETEGKNEIARDAQVRTDMARMGYTKEALLNIAVMHEKGEKIQEKLRGEITEVTDEELQAAYDEKVADDAENYSTGSAAFESAMTGDAVVYSIPEGYRTVKHILVKPEDSVMTAYTDAVSALRGAQNRLNDLDAELANAADDDVSEGARAEDEIKADIAAAEAALSEQTDAVAAAEQACLENVKAKTEAIEERLAAGEDFIALMQEFGEDPGMQNEPTATRGYYVSAASTNWESNFTGAAMALQNVGDVSAPVVSGSGVHIIRYESDVQPGAVPLADVRDALYEETLEGMKTAHCEETIAAWVEAEKPTYDVAAFEKAIANAN